MNDTHEEYVSEEIAKLLKEAGFDWECHACYQNSVFYEFTISHQTRDVLIMNFNDAPVYMNQCSAPSLHVAQEWLRTLNYHVDVVFDCDSTDVFFHARWLHNENAQEWLRTLNYPVDVASDYDNTGVFFHARWLHNEKPERYSYLCEAADDRYYKTYKTHKEALEAVILFVLKQYIKERDEKKD